jgi:hypothetical protein
LKPTLNASRSVLLFLACLALGSPAARACATCFGRSDSPLAEGMNMGILVLLGVILSVLAVLATFFIFLARRAAAVARAASTRENPSPV